MPRTARTQDQLGFDETVVAEPALESALEERLRRKVVVDAARKAYDDANVIAKGEIEKLELPEDKAVRVGRFRLTRVAVSAHPVSFEVKSSSRVKITFLGDDEGEDLPTVAEALGQDAPPPALDPTQIETLRHRAQDARTADQPPVVTA